jgi:DNA adenine methylase
MSSKPIRSPVKWHGGKHYLCHRIIDLFPPHNTYVEPFGGGASVLLNKEPSPVEVYNDLDHAITRLFRVIRDDPDRFQKLLALTPYSEVEFGSDLPETTDETELARRDFVRWRMSLGGRGKAFSYTKHRVRRGMADVVSGYLSIIDEVLPEIVERLRSVQLIERSAKDVIRLWDSPDTLFYCDPPYVHSTRNKRTLDAYGVEMTEADHRELADALRRVTGRVILSGYPSALYDELYGDWHYLDCEIANHASSTATKSRMTERLWCNWDVSSIASQAAEPGDGAKEGLLWQ